MLQWFLSHCVGLRSKNSGNGGRGREKSGNGWQGAAEEESMSTFA